MQFLYDILPVFLFFITFKLYGIYTATTVGIIATALQVVIHRLWKKKWEKQQLITLIIFTLFGGMTLYFHNPIFVKWKPTIVFWVFAVILLGSQLFTSVPLIKRMMGHVVDEKNKIPLLIWKKINLAWVAFFTLLGATNLYIAYQFSNDAWVNFKFYGITSALIIFTIAQSLYLMKYLPEEK